MNALRLHELGKVCKTKDELLASISPLVKQVETWAGLGPLLKPYLSLLYAEVERVVPSRDSKLETQNSKLNKKARGLYLDAIDSAHEQGYTFLEGYINECLGELLLNADQRPAGIYFAEAARLYRKCRADRKETELLKKYSAYFEEETAAPAAADATASSLPNLDVIYLMKSAFAISAEIEQDTLLKKIMNVVIESSGAQHGYLLIEDEGELFVRAESHLMGKQTAQALNQKLEDVEGICKAIVRYVQRTGEKVILNDACQEGMFKDDPEAQKLQLRSVLCLPLVKQAGMIGKLYLENRLVDSVFTPGKTLMTELLASQASHLS